ncbi:alpha/beta hydrolase fold domain-containing protein [Kordia sp.]|jgi:pimeloyl-ACP methyl ester carboxylesterase|uniref:alpha/beta hydrolase family protein n=1 Tax=Kordia sp. TaxID=1965332 RepID=UPI0025BB2660|nr:alpha/beta hydrolase fold domain-containing protein [Kordia sp.]MCH2080928.1 alpha/beta hydrolase fold domain-containing protein [Saprospiraceae bacterium]MCH2193278.1 alpha/beta hydrolase fold domain-containing protein [Kordia sp.]
MRVLRNIPLKGADERSFLLDCYCKTAKPLSTVLFVHGFKGFKDWGMWDAIARYFANAGFLFVKFNFSHNGTTLKSPSQFNDLVAFGNNNYTKEITDIDAVLEWLFDKPKELAFIDQMPLSLFYIGHSRGGGLGIVKTATDPRVTGLITWAAVSHLDYAWRKEGFVEQWKNDGVYYASNARTKQQMPLYFQFYEDFKLAGRSYDTAYMAAHLKQPVLIIHGTNDPAVTEQAAYELKEWLGSKAQMQLIKGANHVFGGSHPYFEKGLPSHAQILVQNSITFIQQVLSNS